MSNPSFGIVGGGWRAEFFLRIARDLPERFPCAGIVIRDAAKREKSMSLWNVPHFASTEELLVKGSPGFVITSVPWSANYPLMEKLASAGAAILTETPVAPTLEEMAKTFALVKSGAKIQVAEQYLFQPEHAARLSFIASGKLGKVSEATVSVAHGYHGLSLIRQYLGIKFELPEIKAVRFKSPLIEGPGRNGPPTEHKSKSSDRVLATLDFGDRLGIYDFSGDQYFSWIRSHYLIVRGERGEISSNSVQYLEDFETPIQFDLLRRDTGHGGNLEGHSLESIQGGSQVLYRNPFAPASWSDDQIAVATCLSKMQNYVTTGESFYGVAEAAQDRYLDMLIDQALSAGTPIKAEPQVWME